jgi:hypothetical protein
VSAVVAYDVATPFRVIADVGYTLALEFDAQYLAVAGAGDRVQILPVSWAAQDSTAAQFHFELDRWGRSVVTGGPSQNGTAEFLVDPDAPLQALVQAVDGWLRAGWRVNAITLALRGAPASPGGTIRNAAAVVMSLRGAFRACYQRELESTPHASGKIRLSVLVGQDGRVSSTTAEVAGNLSPATVECVRATASAARFDAPEGGRAVVRVPITFQLSGDSTLGPCWHGR